MALLFRMFSNKWINPPKDTTGESFSGKNVIVTGANTGIGIEAAAKFAALGAAKVILAVRDLKKGDAAKAIIESRTSKKDQLEVWQLDLNSYDSVVAFAERVNTLDHLDVAVLNAGVRKIRFVQSTQGWEETLQVNTISTALLGILLLPKLQESKRITGKIPVLEFVNSGLHQNAKIDSKILKGDNILKAYNAPENFGGGKQYSLSKLFLMFVASTLAAEVSCENVLITSICPGAVKTEIGRDFNFPGVAIGLAIFAAVFMRTPEQGSRMIVSGTTQGEGVHGRFWQHDQIQPIAPSLGGEENKKIAARVWTEIIQVLGEDVPPKRSLLQAWMPTPPFRRKPTAHGTASFLRYLFPHTRQRARARLSKFRHETLPSLQHRTQSRIYRYILYRQALKLKRKPGILQRLRGHTRKLLGSDYLENEVRLRRQKLMQQPYGSDSSRRSAMSYPESYGAREPGARRKKLAGYLKAANELRQSYQQQYAPGFSRNQSAYEYEDDTPGSFPDAAVVRNGDEDMVLFPSYARKHTDHRQPQAEPGTIQDTPGDGRDVRDLTGAGDAEFWKQQWDAYEDDNALVDVDVRGWIYSPHKGQMSRKQRLFIGLARQLVGIQAPPAGTRPPSANMSPASSREPSPGNIGHSERARVRQAQRDDILTAREAEEILRKGEKEAEAASQGAYSERPTPDDSDNTYLYRAQSRDSVRSSDSRGHLRPQKVSPTPSSSSFKDEEKIKPIQKRESWRQPANMSPAELAEANAHLMARLRHFLAIPMANTPISVFFYNDEISKQRTVYTNPSGHFNVRAALDFIPTHVRILASDKLSATEEIIVTEPRGVSLISDIDDTIKHSAISSGAREIFRNAFIRELGDLTIEGVKEWYTKMAEMGVKFHYVSNSPWQLYPVISKFFSMAGLPPGSFHLKQYSGMLQGIFEPVAERKKSTLDKIARDFPERSFILVGDSGEADLEVYTDFVLENPGRVLAVFIRDVTTPVGGGFFDPSVGPIPGDRSSSPSQRGSGSTPSRYTTSSSGFGEDEDPELRAAIEASLRDMDNDNGRKSRSIFPQIDEDHPELRPKLPARKTTQPPPPQPVEKLINLSDDEPESTPALRRLATDTLAEKSAHQPPIAPKPSIPPSQQTYAGMARDKLLSAYNNLPSASSYLQPSNPTLKQAQASNPSSEQGEGVKKTPPPPPPPRKGVTSYPAVASSYVGTKAASAWNYAPNLPHPSTRPTVTQHANSYSTTTSTQYPNANLNRTNTGSTLGMNGNNTTNGNAGMNKREILWRQRWARAEQVFAEKGVVLRTWRVGTDVLADAERLVKEAGEREKREGGGVGGKVGL
ncbi:uncharacterized protein BDR25DRAFT_296114 [Lindgomyces ingoldianus]|uniref:Uncharacterized protein n=1 Tax=Lindgomyces ingoldianus TaxID=673940 RepID=A0ACB6QDA1_9PLEO|nr:uncharacterized protein BDR25DRAFT_296114 [Lindgomyces ingoldianus]KAF2464928.1 hypothetical protein BDR25DRAFT_296114 [Lindgomyces ingoldianus]